MPGHEKSLYQLTKLNKQLTKACGKKNPDMAAIRQLVDDGACITWRSSWDSSTPLRNAIYRGNIEVVQFLIEKGVLVNDTSDPLGSAIVRHNEKIVDMLIEAGARPTLQHLRTARDIEDKQLFARLLRCDLNFDATVEGSTKNYVIYCAEILKDPAIMKLAEEALERHRNAVREAPAPAADPRDARIAALEAQIKALSGSLTAVQAELEDIKNPAPVLLDKTKRPPEPKV